MEDLSIIFPLQGKMANDIHSNAKVSGYLEKKGRLKMVSPWKKYWFVLEGRLLLYYRSKAEYESIGPCKGTITLAPPCAVKPTLNSNCTFQVETRANTVTLRAENKCDYEKWIKAILMSLDLSSIRTSKVYHFRYSEDNLAQASKNKEKSATVLSRQNTMPERLTLEKKGSFSNGTIIERLQKLGARSYGGSLQSINKFCKMSPKLPKNENLQRLLKNSSLENISRTEESFNHEYAQVNKIRKNFNNAESSAIEANKVNENIEELTSAETDVIITNDAYASIRPVDVNGNNDLVDKKVVLPNQLQVEAEINLPVNRISDEYCTIEETMVNNVLRETGSEYCCIDETRIVNVETTAGNNLDEIKELENEIVIENLDYITRIGYELPPNLSGVDKVGTKANESIYASADEIYQKDIEPALPPRPQTSEEHVGDLKGSQNGLEKPKKTSRLKKLTRLMSDRRRGDSFVVRVFKKMTKQSSKEDIRNDIEEKDKLRKQSLESDIKMLNELEILLQSKKEASHTKVSSIKSSLVDINENDRLAPEIDVCSSIQHQESFERQPSLEESQISDQHILEDHGIAPMIPPKQRRRHLIVLQYPEPDNIENFYIPRLKLKNRSNRPQPPTPTSAEPEEKLKTIDEILDDLDKEKSAQEKSNKQNVKQLIEKFNNENCYSSRNQLYMDEVELRKKPLNFKQGYRRESEDLNELLLELSKVTSAPIQSPRIASSLSAGAAIQVDEEWLNLVALRKRRLSEPDYDIPRPHSSLQIPKMVKNRENAIEPTRFFGHALLDNNDTSAWHTNEEIITTSMAPDSLEVTTDQNRNQTEEEKSSVSYTSHHYLKFHNKSLDKKTKDPNGRPKSLELLDNKTVYSCEHLFHKMTSECALREQEDDNYEDSLEPSK